MEKFRAIRMRDIVGDGLTDQAEKRIRWILVVTVLMFMTILGLLVIIIYQAATDSSKFYSRIQSLCKESDMYCICMPPGAKNLTYM
jgi:hypothetical protein